MNAQQYIFMKKRLSPFETNRNAELSFVQKEKENLIKLTLLKKFQFLLMNIPLHRIPTIHNFSFVFFFI